MEVVNRVQTEPLLRLACARAHALSTLSRSRVNIAVFAAAKAGARLEAFASLTEFSASSCGLRAFHPSCAFPVDKMKQRRKMILIEKQKKLSVSFNKECAIWLAPNHFQLSASNISRQVDCQPNAGAALVTSLVGHQCQQGLFLECLRVTTGTGKTSSVQTCSGTLLLKTSARNGLLQRKCNRKSDKRKQTPLSKRVEV